MTGRDIRIDVPVLARVEGEGALELDIRDGRIQDLKLRIYEPPRFFEQFMCGFEPDRVIDTVARICGICPAAYQVTAVQAFEQLFGIDIAPHIRDLRRAMYCGEWLQSHALHIHMLAAPDFLGFDSGIAMAEAHPEAVRRGLRLQSLGNALLAMFGGRSVHPVGLRVGGFHHAPDPARVEAMCRRLETAIPEAEAVVAWAAGLPLPDDTQEFLSVSLRGVDHYPIASGDIVSDQGFSCSAAQFDAHMQEFQVPHSTALHASLNGEPYLVGPLARLNLNRDLLTPRASRALRATGVAFPSANMFHSIVARSIEVLVVLEEALRLLSAYDPGQAVFQPWQARAGEGVAATEAPRGLLWHRYRVDDQGQVSWLRIVPPTSQNQARCEADIRQSLEALGLERTDRELQLRAETVIRNYDPCISCATHFLRLKTHRN